MKVKAESFHLNGHIIGFRPQTKKLDSLYKIPSNTLAVKGLKGISFAENSKCGVSFQSFVLRHFVITLVRNTKKPTN